MRDDPGLRNFPSDDKKGQARRDQRARARWSGWLRWVRRVRRAFEIVVALAVFIGIVGAVLLMGVPRPRDTTEAAVFASDGAEVDYCVLPELDGTGRPAAEIPKAFTPGCAFTTWPMPVLADCTEPLAEGVVDMRGLWRGSNGEVDHVERIEQCGNRTVITAAGIIHDFVADGTLRNGARDVMGGGRCFNIFAAVKWNEGVMSFRPFGIPGGLVTRRLVGEELVWRYPGVGELGMERICRVPESHLVGGMVGSGQ